VRGSIRVRLASGLAQAADQGSKLLEQPAAQW
jgi:hypothetical protein